MITYYSSGNPQSTEYIKYGIEWFRELPKDQITIKTETVTTPDGASFIKGSLSHLNWLERNS